MNSKEKLDKFLLSLLGSEELVHKWWNSPNKAFDMKTPQEVFDRDKDEVKAYVIKQLVW